MDIESPLKVGRHLVIPAAELEWRFSASGGPGGQHANTANTRVELIFDVAGSAALAPASGHACWNASGPVPASWWSTSALRSVTVRSPGSAWPTGWPRLCGSNGLAGRPCPPRPHESAGYELSRCGPPARWSDGRRRRTLESRLPVGPSIGGVTGAAGRGSRPGEGPLGRGAWPSSATEGYGPSRSRPQWRRRQRRRRAWLRRAAGARGRRQS